MKVLAWAAPIHLIANRSGKRFIKFMPNNCLTQAMPIMLTILKTI